MPIMEGMEFLHEILGDIDEPGPGEANCETCGSSAFFSEYGFFYCSLCNTQSQQTREYIEDEQFQGARMNARSAGILREERQIRNVIRSERRLLLSNWEVFNYTLRAMTNRLIEIGFPRTFKDKVFTLWTSYLLRRNVLVLNAQINKKFRLKFGEPNLNKYALSDTLKTRKQILKRKVISSDQTDDGLLSASQFKKRRSTAQRKAIEKEYIIRSSQDLDEGSEYGNSRLRKQKQELYPAPKKKKKIPMQMSDQCKQLFQTIKRTENEDETKLNDKNELNPKENIEYASLSNTKPFKTPENFSLKTLLALVFVALRQVGCRILYTDVIRMVCDGTLFVNSIRFLIDDSCEKSLDLNSDLFLQMKSMGVKNLQDVATNITYVLEYLGITSFRYPSAVEFIPKFMEDLVLPRELECLIYQLDKMLPFVNQLPEITHKQYDVLIELHILSSIIVVLKMLFGLDDVTEKYQSEFARACNKLIERETKAKGSDVKWLELFVIEDWFQYIRYREEVVRLELFCPTMYCPLKVPNFNRLNDIVARFSGQKGDDADPKREKIETKRKAARDMFRTFSEENWPTPEVPNYVTVALPKENVVQEFIRSHPNVNYPNLKTSKLISHFKTQRIDFVYNPDKYVKLLKKAGYKVTVLQGDARNYKPSLQKDKDQNILLFQPFKLFDDFCGSGNQCSASLDFILNVCTTVVSGPQVQKSSRARLECIVKQIGDAYCKRCYAGFVPTYPYSDDDSVTSDRESESD